MTRFVPLLAVVAVTTVEPGAAATDRYAITAEEHAACDTDAINLCSGAQPDEDRLLACMKAKRNQLSPGCRTVFAAGLRRRHIPF